MGEEPHHQTAITHQADRRRQKGQRTINGEEE
jgi:hypothetical protein